MIQIDIGPVWSQIKGTEVPFKLLDDACSFFVKAALNSRKYRGNGGWWDGRVHLYKQGKFPTGLWFKIREVLDKQGIEYSTNLQFDWEPPQWAWKLSKGITPYEEQVKAVEAATACKRGILKCPTGFGKTAVLAAGMIAAFG